MWEMVTRPAPRARLLSLRLAPWRKSSGAGRLRLVKRLAPIVSGRGKPVCWIVDGFALDLRQVSAMSLMDRVTKSDVVRSAIEMYLNEEDGSRDSLVRIEEKLDAVLTSIRESDAGEVEDISASTAEPLEDRE